MIMAVRAGLTAGAATLRYEAQLRTPVGTGELVDSARAQVDGDEATVSFGTDHAIVVHEKLDLHHTNGQAKFLESALTDEQDSILQSIADAMASVLK